MICAVIECNRCCYLFYDLLFEEFGRSFKYQALDGLSLLGFECRNRNRDQGIKDSSVHIVGKHESLSLLGGTYL